MEPPGTYSSLWFNAWAKDGDWMDAGRRTFAKRLPASAEVSAKLRYVELGLVGKAHLKIQMARGAPCSGPEEVLDLL